MSWKKIKFSELFAEPTRNGVYKPSSEHGEGCKIVNMGEIFAYTFIGNQDMQRISMSDEELIKSGLRENDLLFARRSLIESGAGKSSIVTKIDEPLTFESSIIRVRLDDKKCYPLFYLYWLRSQAGITEIRALVTGTNVKGIRGSALKDIDVDYPDYDTQYKLATYLKVFDDLIENNLKQIKLLEEAAERLYKEWFVDLRFPGHEETKISDGVPEGWEKVKISDVSSVLCRGISPRYNNEGKYTVLNQKCIRHSIVSFDEARRQEKEYPPKLNVQDSDTVICSTGSGTLGRVGQIFGEYPNTTIDSHVTLVRAIENFGRQYLFLSLKNKQQYLMNMGRGSTNQLELSRTTIQDIDTLLPTDSILKNFESLTQDIHTKINVLNKQINYLIDARNRLLPKLMNGEIEVE